MHNSTLPGSRSDWSDRSSAVPAGMSEDWFRIQRIIRLVSPPPPLRHIRRQRFPLGPDPSQPGVLHLVDLAAAADTDAVEGQPVQRRPPGDEVQGPQLQAQLART